MAQEYRSEILERQLKTLHIAVEGVKASVIVNIDGLLVAAFPPGNEDNPHENPTSSPDANPNTLCVAEMINMEDSFGRRDRFPGLTRLLPTQNQVRARSRAKRL